MNSPKRRPIFISQSLFEIGLVLFGVTIVVNLLAQLLLRTLKTSTATRGCLTNESDTARQPSLAQIQERAGFRPLDPARAVLVIAPLGLVFFYLLQKGAGSVNWAFFTQLPKPVGEAGGGMANAIVGTLRACSASPRSSACRSACLGGVYLSEYGTAASNWWLRFVADVLNGVPSIIWGMVVYGWSCCPSKASPPTPAASRSGS